MSHEARAVRWNNIALFVGAAMLLAIGALLVVGAIGPFQSWAGDRASEFQRVQPAVMVTLLQTALVAIAGIWALYLYASSRANQTTISISPTCWLAEARIDTFHAFNVRVRVTNVSKAVCRNCEATVTLMDASARDEATGQLSMPTFAEQDPWANLYPDPSEDFPVSLEPGESIDSEATFLLTRLSLLGVRISVDGDQGLFRSPFSWNSFFVVDVSKLKPTHSGLGSMSPPSGGM